MRTANSNEGLAGDVTRSIHCQCFLMLVSKMVCYVEQLAASLFFMIVLMKVRANSTGLRLDGEERPESGSRSWCGSEWWRKNWRPPWICCSKRANGTQGEEGQMAARAMGLGKPEGQGGMSAKSVLGSGLLGAKGVVAGAALDLVKSRKNK